jgi:predicted  nucleic acid-binding Zn-ribbon protein
MKSKAVWLSAGILALTVPAFAQSGGADALSALLVEVRQLRIAMERAATTTPHIQLLRTRLSIQNDRLARAERDYSTVRQQLESVSGQVSQLTAQIEELENQSARETEPERQRMLGAEQVAMKRRAAELTAGEQQLRVRESELAATLGSEQNQWAELNRRLDEVERSIGVPPPR